MDIKTADQSWLPRQLRSSVMAALADTPVVCLLGPRQCGKSTLAKMCEPERPYISLDEKVYLDLALNDPQGFIDELPDRITIDEVQRAPELALAIKRSVDANRSAGRFLLTGSANLMQLPRLADSLAGRMESLYLHPFTKAEIHRRTGSFLVTMLAGRLPVEIRSPDAPTPSALPKILLTGGYPEAVRRAPERAERWQRNYIQSVIERDVRDIAEVKDASNLKRLLALLADRTAQLLNQSELANSLGHTRATIDRYLTLLERLFLIRRLPAWHSNRTKRLVKSPKLHFVDSGLAATLSELEADQWNVQRARFGHLLESFVLQQLTAMADCMSRPPHFYHYRDKDKIEVDIVIESSGKVWGIEVKAAASVNKTDIKGLLKLAGVAGSAFRGGIILYDGAATFHLDNKSNILAVPISKLWEL
ncbi:ATP-binding protein [Pseudohongiella spirulinae]|uniref:AAA family ATPase n=1 Tax=Pseudohongiella spirulinae TaxID=1249552 RepID=A0A0S2KAY6_9GAMM|nr:ATP-binding protein [Pseudohongiella spirulinae]ALO45317.1 AAA family ATPase [Pseudohongiella spirulinae]